jgi:hypothetical protein
MPWAARWDCARVFLQLAALMRVERVDLSDRLIASAAHVLEFGTLEPDDQEAPQPAGRGHWA